MVTEKEKQLGEALVELVKPKPIDELCDCGHSKKCHGRHELDNHGAECNQCNCNIYTWEKFVFMGDEP